jgi:hypothetical protein
LGGDRTAHAASSDAVLAALAAARHDHVAIKIVRPPDGRVQVSVRGALYDGRRFLRAMLAALFADGRSSLPPDLDLDMRVARLRGFNGEALRRVALRFSRQAGVVQAFRLSGRFASGARLEGGLRDVHNDRVITLETRDAGAFFRLADIYRHMRSGQLAAAIDVRTPERAVQEGMLAVRHFRLSGERTLRSLTAPQREKRAAARAYIAFARLRVDFKSSPDRVELHNGLLVGSAFGATIEGNIEVAGSALALRGVVIPLTFVLPPKNAIPWSPKEWTPTGWPSEGLFGLRYQLAGAPSAPVLRIDPAELLTPGFLRRLLDPKSAEDPKR